MKNPKDARVVGTDIFLICFPTRRVVDVCDWKFRDTRLVFRGLFFFLGNINTRSFIVSSSFVSSIPRRYFKKIYIFTIGRLNLIKLLYSINFFVPTAWIAVKIYPV